jgi:hypothetical protein
MSECHSGLSGFWTLSTVRWSKEHDVSETVICCRPVIEVSHFYWAQQSRCLPPLIWGRKIDPVSETSCSLNHPTVDKFQKKKKTIMPSDIYHRQNALEFACECYPHGPSQILSRSSDNGCIMYKKLPITGVRFACVNTRLMAALKFVITRPYVSQNSSSSYPKWNLSYTFS